MSAFVVGTTRNLTSAFRRHRDDARRSRGASAAADLETAALLNSALGGSQSQDVEMAALMAPAWVHQSEKIRMDLTMLKERLNKLKEAHGRALLVTFGDSGKEAQMQAEALTRELQSGFKRVNREIAAIEASLNPEDDVEVQKQVRQQLARALMAMTQEFRKEETRFLNKVEAQKGFAAGPSGGLGLAENDSSAALDAIDMGFTTTQTLNVNMSNVMAEERDSEIQAIVDTITELAQIMRDLGALVVEQGSLLDRIDHNIQDSAVKIEQGVSHIQQADKKQKSGAMFICISALAVLVIVMIIVVAAKLALKVTVG